MTQSSEHVLEAGAGDARPGKGPREKRESWFPDLPTRQALVLGCSWTGRRTQASGSALGAQLNET